jgi:hypothetical protein
MLGYELSDSRRSARNAAKCLRDALKRLAVKLVWCAVIDIATEH